MKELMQYLELVAAIVCVSILFWIALDLMSEWFDRKMEEPRLSEEDKNFVNPSRMANAEYILFLEIELETALKRESYEYAREIKIELDRRVKLQEKLRV